MLLVAVCLLHGNAMDCRLRPLWQFTRKKKPELGGQFIAIPIGMVSGSRPKSAVLRLSERHRLGSANRFIKPALIWI